jgi:hypothetical protein
MTHVDRDLHGYEAMCLVGGYPEDGGDSFSEMLVTTDKTVWCHDPGDHSVLCTIWGFHDGEDSVFLLGFGTM